MSRVPRIRFKGFEEDWEQRKLGEVAIFSKGVGYSKSDLKDSGIPIILYGRLYTNYEIVIKDVDTFADGICGAVYSKGGEIITPSSGETSEDISIASVVKKSGVLLGGDLNIIYPQSFLNPIFIAISISNGKPHKEMAKRAQGKSVVHLHNVDLSKIEIDYPSIDEQTRISSYFISLDHLITLHQRKLEKLKIIKKSMLENLFPQNGEKTPKIRFSGFTEDWEQRKLGEVANRFDSTRIPISENLRVSGKTPYYGANGIQDYVDGYTHDGEYVLIAEDGANDLKNYPIRLVKGRIWVNNHAHVIQGMEKFMNNQFINFAMSQVDFESIVVGCGRAKLNAEQLMDICFKIPNKNEQANIGRLFESINHLITLHQSKLDKLQKIKKSMLESMFV